MATYEIHITKAGKSAMLTVDDAVFTDETFAAIMAEGIKACLNSRMAKVGPVTKLEGDELAKAQAKAMEIAQENLEALSSGKFRFPGQKSKSPEKREVINEAVRLAREVLRDQAKRAGFVISHFPAKDLTNAAKTLVESDESFIAKAKENLARRSEVPVAAIDLAALGLKPDPAKVAKAEAAKAQRKENLSAKQAGKVAGRTTKSKPKASIAEVLAGVQAGNANAAHKAVH